ncbi:ATP-binding protein [Salinibacterium hongtaonis]|uniref:LuxR family transcriptional regulator n=1 Tax=Homoserinimonas hongtaonis TaxID=2079791 RepID=A0A2U1SXU2_9MICO|nr:LuxR family transcriptional regulator [Salinibacterium hongtaonis]PWB96447.1 LuxR family transcriptional regulator [Salinibacterium hongtaonis]
MSKLLGRRLECREVEQLLVEAQASRSAVLVVHGDAGMGKTALLEHLRDAAVASRFRVESSTGIEAETQFAFAGLHQFCAPFLEHLSALPEPQQIALGVALGMRSGPAPDRFLIGLATLNLVAEGAEQDPLLCLVDDAQWLDQASAEVVAFVARRVDAERLAMVFGVRDVGGVPSVFSGLPGLKLTGLDGAAARRLLDTAFLSPLDNEVRERIIAEARGNPLALLELPANVAAARLAGGYALPDLSDLPGRIEHGFQRRSNDLPEATQLLLLAAAAEPTGDPVLLFRATTELGMDSGSAAPAEAAGLIEIDSRVRFRHPLVRSAVYRSANPADRRRVHSALAAATDADLDPDRRAWHRAQAVRGVDEEAAADLERSAGRALARGGYAAAGAFLQRSTELTPEVADRTRRALEAAQAMHSAGASQAALDLLTTAEGGSPNALERARIQLLRAQIAFHINQVAEVPEMLADAAATLASSDPALSRETYLHALDTAIINGLPKVALIADRALAAPTVAPPRPVDLLLDGLAVTIVRGVEAGTPRLRLALDALSQSINEGTVVEGGSQPWLWLASRLAVGILDEERAHQLAEYDVTLSRSTGALARLPAALVFHAHVLTFSGKIARAEELGAEAEIVTESTGGFRLRRIRAVLAAWRGDRALVAESNDLTLRDERVPEGSGEAALAHYASAVLHNGLGDYSLAQRAAAKTCDSAELSLSTIALPELIEASVRAGDQESAAHALERFSSRARASGSAWALGLEARSRALTITGAAAEEHYLAAIAHLSGTRIAREAARAHLVYGEWLRREGRRQEARDHLRTAHELLSDMGVEAFAERAARELHATGEHARKRTARPSDELTAQELHIARLVATGATSREVGSQLFLSPRTIESHLRNIFRKLEITSRRQLKELQLT